MKREVTIAYSFREYREDVIEMDVPDDDYEPDEDEVREALGRLGTIFSEDEEFSLDWAVVDV